MEGVRRQTTLTVSQTNAASVDVKASSSEVGAVLAGQTIATANIAGIDHRNARSTILVVYAGAATFTISSANTANVEEDSGVWVTKTIEAGRVVTVTPQAGIEDAEFSVANVPSLGSNGHAISHKLRVFFVRDSAIAEPLVAVLRQAFTIAPSTGGPIGTAEGDSAIVFSLAWWGVRAGLREANTLSIAVVAQRTT